MSTGYLFVTYTGGVVEHSSNMPDTVALSIAEVEYNEACSACRATEHLKQFLEDLELHLDGNKTSKKPIQVFIDKGVQLTWVLLVLSR
jgi:hypothetical protein